jgi:hypothetical protein
LVLPNDDLILCLFDPDGNEYAICHRKHTHYAGASASDCVEKLGRLISIVLSGKFMTDRELWHTVGCR